MKVTDEMVHAACNAYDDHLKGHNNVLLRGVATGHGMKAALEAAMQAAWIKFDVDDKSTWPPLDTIVITSQGLPAALDDRYTWYLEDYALEDQFVTYWTHLPVYKGE
jgi:hypothetical protein